ncbi:helix-turn-helix domain-containing protein [Actinoplanes sp. NPDC051494]|uniref:helix-turn-helix domain-containing protein n=1 Tax=Actinoplanes sp. NPDC051494 TaxID=3363907 RepID=UPI0037B3906C
MTGPSNLLGAFLRARRDLVTPEQAGVPVLGVRRVPGLRREEVAMLAGISADYYLRLERGRDRSPSVQVLESLARVLHLDDTTRDHLLGLAGGVPAGKRCRRAPRSS